MVLLRKRLPGERYARLVERYMTQQKQDQILRMLNEQSYTWIQGIGEDNRDSDEQTKLQTKEKGK